MDKFLNKEFLVSHREQIIKAAAVIIIIVVAFFVFTGKGDDEEDAAAVVSDGSAQTEDVKGQDPAGTAEAGAAAGTQGAETRILVDVSGAVNKPAVVELLPGSRVQDAIDAAGGLKKRADITGINRAAEVKDGEKIDIPFKNRSGTSQGAYSGHSGFGDQSDGSLAAGQAGGMININTADTIQLQTLTGIGPALAERIITYREQNGQFMSIEDIKNVSGIGEKTFEKFRDQITI